MSAKPLDAAGQEIKVGDVVAYGVHAGSSAIQLNTAEVISVKPGKGMYPWCIGIVQYGRDYCGFAASWEANLKKTENIIVTAETAEHYRERCGV